MKDFLIRLIKFYQRRISPLFGPRCRYYPTCSHYAVEAIERFGVIYGSFLTIKRLSRCNIFFPGGYDPVPEKKCRKKYHQSKNLSCFRPCAKKARKTAGFWVFFTGRARRGSG